MDGLIPSKRAAGPSSRRSLECEWSLRRGAIPRSAADTPPLEGACDGPRLADDLLGGWARLCGMLRVCLSAVLLQGLQSGAQADPV